MDQVERLLRLAAAASLAGVERSVSYGTPSLKLRGKFMARLSNAETLVIRCPVEEKAMLIEAEPRYYFETDHYRGYDAILVHVRRIDDERLTARLIRAWEMQAGKRLRAARDAQKR